MAQQIVVILIFLIAAGYLGWRVWKSFARKQTGGCAKGCGCEVDKAPSSLQR
ncbi:FeoB-associated Cys-rich membrane protein [Telluribacter sp.]|jgi:hypothetical protein|uniref:FeoB-associated Cys-rich membrane protein n=1 Tax=Telluribacter sp. TaxID=1978767 RepID=UPI002E112925|nr:FeoB-associated Cys-rich membrane protein [Telluribacter sp.]